MERLCFHRGRLESKILEEVGSEKSEADEDKVREKFVYIAKMGNKMKFVYIKLYEMSESAFQNKKKYKPDI